MVGTGAHGHTYPGATVPFGEVQLSPDTPLQGWDGSSGYHYSDKTILGFSHTHLSGTGCADLGDLLILPFTATPEGPTGKRKKFSATARRKMAMAQKARWAKARGEWTPSEEPAAEHKRRVSSARSKAAKARWAKAKAAGRSRL